MDKFLAFGVTGLVLAAIYSVIASGLVVTYTTTGIFNFAHGAVGMISAFAYWQLRFDWGLPAPVALAILLLGIAPAIGLAIEAIVRGLHDTSETIKLVVTIAMLSALIAAARWIWNPNEARPFPRFFAGSDPIDIGPTNVNLHQIITLAAAAGVAVGLRFVLHRTRVGVAMRAGVDDRTLSVLNGADPHRSARIAWMIGSSLAALGGVLIAPNVALDAGQLSLLIVSAYAAAIFGRLRSLPLTFVGAVVVGCTESYLTGYLPSNQYLPGLRLAAPAVILLLVLLAIPNPRLSGRTRTREDFPLPTWAGGLVFAGASVLIAAVLATTLAASDMVTYARIFPMAIIALSFVVLIGFAGQISLCQLSFAGIGALTFAHLGGQGQVWALFAAALVAGAVGAIVALPALRLSGIYLALGTAAFAMMLDRWIFGLPDFAVFGLFDVKLFRQSSANVAALDVFGYTFDTPRSQMVLSAVVFAALSLGVVALRRGVLGRRLLAIKDSEAACATLGGGILSTKVLVFSLSSAIAGVGGALLGMQLRTISATDFDLVAGLPVLVLAVVAGIASVAGALFVGLALTGMLPAMTVLFPALDHVAAVLPGLAGVILGKHPNGAMRDIGHIMDPVRRDRVTLVMALGVFAASWGLRLIGAIDNWVFALGVVAAIVVPRVVVAVRSAPAEADEEDVPIEWRGLRRPWTAADLDEIDAVLGIQQPTATSAKGEFSGASRS